MTDALKAIDGVSDAICWTVGGETYAQITGDPAALRDAIDTIKFHLPVGTSLRLMFTET